MASSFTWWISPHLPSTPGVGGVVQALKNVLVSGFFSCALGKFLCESQTSVAEIVFQPQSLAVLHKLLPPGVTASDGSHSPLVDPGQVPLL